MKKLFRAKQRPQRYSVRRGVSPVPFPDPGNDKAFPSSRALRLVRRLPLPIVASPERVVLNFALFLVGVSAFMSHESGSVIRNWPLWVIFYWGLALGIGGVCVLIGLFRHATSVERLGYLLVGPACVLYAISVVAARGWIGIPSCLIFAGIGVAKAIRMVISSAERDMTIEFGERLDRESQEDS